MSSFGKGLVGHPKNSRERNKQQPSKVACIPPFLLPSVNKYEMGRRLAGGPIANKRRPGILMIFKYTTKTWSVLLCSPPLSMVSYDNDRRDDNLDTPSLSYRLDFMQIDVRLYCNSMDACLCTPERQPYLLYCTRSGLHRPRLVDDFVIKYSHSVWFI